MKPDYEDQLGCIPMLAIFIVVLIVLCSCEKQPSMYDIASKGDSVSFDIQTRAYTRIVIENWGTGFDATKDSIYKLSAWDKDRNILGRSFDVWIFTDTRWEFVGYGIVHNTNMIRL